VGPEGLDLQLGPGIGGICPLCGVLARAMGDAGVRGQRQSLSPCLNCRMPLRFQQTQQGKAAGVVVFAVLEAQVTAQNKRGVAAGLAGATGSGGWIQPLRNSRPSAGLGRCW
jgi:hypothetical protein